MTTRTLALADAPGNLVRFVPLPGQRFDTAGVAPLRIDAEMYRGRHLTENFFRRLKEFKSIARPAGKTAQSFPAMIPLAAAVINSR